MEPRTLTLAELRQIVSDAGELGKGAQLFSSGGLAHLARFETRLSADAKGSGAMPYKVQADLAKLERGRCSCMAARSRPWCKHAAALLVAWASQPAAFAVSTEAPPSAGATRAKSVKRGAVDANALLAQGVAQVVELVGELAVGGVASVGTDRAEAIRELAEPLRANRLRRLSARVLELADRIALSQKGQPVDAVAWTDTLADMLLAARKIEKHLAGQAMEDRYVEELIGKSWTKKDRTPVESLQLVEVGYSTRVTADDFRIVESRFVDLASGEPFCEKQILPLFLARQTEPKRSWAGLRLDANGGRFPGFAPVRLDIENAQSAPLTQADLARLAQRTLPGVAGALTALQERRKDVFAPDLLPVALKVGAVVATTRRLLAADADGSAIFLPDDAQLVDRMAEALRGVALLAAFGDLGVDGALPTLFPSSFLVHGAGGLELRALTGVDVASVRSRRKRPASAAPSRWVEVARAAEVSRPAVALGEAREELANAVLTGMAAFTPRAAEPIAARLAELGLQKPAALLVEAARKPDPRERFDEVVKVHQVTGIAIVRLAGALTVERAALEASGEWPAVLVIRSEERVAPEEIGRRLVAGEIDRFRAAALQQRWYAGADIEELLAERTWADASAAPWVARLASRAPERALQRASAILGRADDTVFGVAKHTAVQVLVALGTPEARKQLELAWFIAPSPARLAWLAATGVRPAPSLWEAAKIPLSRKLGAEQGEDLAARSVLSAPGPDADARQDAIRALVAKGDTGAIPLLRRVAALDGNQSVRRAAADALARLCDLGSVEGWIQALADRRRDDRAAVDAARALEVVRDSRAVGLFLAAYQEVWHTQVCLDGLLALGPLSLDPLLAWVEASPELSNREGIRNLCTALLRGDAAPVIARLRPSVGQPEFASRAAAFLRLVDDGGALQRDSRPTALATLAAWIAPHLAGATDKESRALAKKVAKYLPSG